MPATKNIYICRRADFTVLKKDTELPSFSTLMENVSLHRQIEEEEEEEEYDVEETQSAAYFAHYLQIPLAYKAKTKDKRFPTSFSET